MKIVTARQMAALDTETIERRRVPGLELMERAGAGIAAETLATIARLELPRRVVLFAGRGNNGGDAFVVARLLHEAGIETLTVLVGATASRPATAGDLKGDALENHRRLSELGAELVEVGSLDELEALRERGDAAGLIVDGLLGTGLSGEPRGLVADAIRFINSLRPPVVAVDIPSGISGDSGALGDCFVRAALTVTMALPKRGCFLGPAINGLGRLAVVDIGIPAELVARAPGAGELMMPDEIAALLPERERLSHKGTYGRLFVLAGSRGLTGAAALAANGAVRAGAGLVFLGIPEEFNVVLERLCTEAMTVPLPQTPEGTTDYDAYYEIAPRLATCDALVIGPGLSTNRRTAALVQRLLAEVELPIVLDADGLNCLDGKVELLHARKGPVIITPHPGELSRLITLSLARIVADPWDAARRTARSDRLTVVLKGAHTCVAHPHEPLWVNIMGNAGMASGGVGDVLSGVLGGLLAQRVAPFDAARLGVLLHALAGDIAAAAGDQMSLIASDLVQALPAAFRWLREKKRQRVGGAVRRCYYDLARTL
jgi:hydroxyethylthiazole kinase-like uncharacterized protein yjeF